MKKITIAVFLIVVVVIGSYCYKKNYHENKKLTINTETEKAQIKKYYIYGTRLNVEGTLNITVPKFSKVDLILFNKKEGNIINYDLNYEKQQEKFIFNLSKEINSGLYLENIPRGEYLIYLRFTSKKNKKDIYKYYCLENKTTYTDTVYYTFLSTNNKITISTNENTFSLKVKENKEDTYDVVINPARGGKDTGTSGNGYVESNIVMEFSNKLKEKLEGQGFKVKLTRNEDDLTSNDYFKEYNKHGRAVISHEVHAKYVFSFHTNSSSLNATNGISIFTAANINYDFATKLIENVTTKTSMKTATNSSFQVDYGIYTHNFSEKEIEENMIEYDNKGYQRYEITKNANYLYMIRETGGMITGAYVDGRNKEVGENPYYNSNVGAESYVIYLGYLTNRNDIEMLTTKQEEYVNVIADTIIDQLSL